MTFTIIKQRITRTSAALLLFAATSMTALTGVVQAAVTNPTPAAKVSFTFDDGALSAYTQAAPTLKKYGLSGTNYVTTSCVGMTQVPNTCRADNDIPYMTWAQIKELQDSYGWEIGSHTATHPYLASSDADDGQPNVLTPAQVSNELTTSKAALAAQGINATAFASPYGDYSNATVAQIAKHYSTHRGFADNRNIDWPNNEYLLTNMPVQAGVSVTAVKTRIDEAIANKQWVVLTFHDIRVKASNNPDDYQYNTADLDAIAAYVKSKQDAGQLKSINISQGPTYGTTSDNILPNSSFDTGIADGWTTDNTAAVTVDTANNGSYPSATNAIKFSPSAAPARLYSPKVTVNSNTTYLLKNYLNVTQVTAGQVEFYIDEYDINGNWISGQYKKAENSAYVENLNFTYKPTSLTVSRASLQVTATANSGITAYLDNVQWLPLDSAIAPEPTPTPNPTTPPTAKTLTFNTAADATIRKNSANSNYGRSQTIEIDNSPVMNGLLKFTVSGTGGLTVKGAKLRLYVENASSNGGAFYGTTTNTWSESTVTWNNAPVASATPFATLGPVKDGQWVEIDASSLIKGDGTYSIRITSSSTDGVDYRTKEASSNKPQLLLSAEQASTTPTPAPAPAPANLIANGTFDAGISQGWTTDDAASLTADATSQGSPNNAVNSIKLTAPTTKNAHLFSPKVSVESTKSYTLTSYVRLSALSSSELGFYIDEYDAAGNWISGQYKFGVNTASTGHVNFTYQPSSAAVASASLQVIVPVNSGLIGYFDDVRWYVVQ